MCMSAEIWSCLKNSISSKCATGQLHEHINEMDQNNSFPEHYPERAWLSDTKDMHRTTGNVEALPGGALAAILIRIFFFLGVLNHM